MSFKNEWKDLQDATAGMPNSGDDITVEPINRIAHQVIINEENITNKVDKEDGKGLSTNDFTDEYKEKVEKSGEQVQNDWSQNDETAPDYIKNRTHYEETVLIGEGTATGDWSIIPLSQSFDWGNASIFVDGREVDYTISDNREFEDLIIVEAESTHQILHYYGASAKPLKITITSWTPAGTHIQIYQNSVKTLDEKYIPESIARVSDVEDKIGDIGEVLDELHNYAQTLLGGDA